MHLRPPVGRCLVVLAVPVWVARCSLVMVAVAAPVTAGAGAFEPQPPWEQGEVSLLQAGLQVLVGPSSPDLERIGLDVMHSPQPVWVPAWGPANSAMEGWMPLLRQPSDPRVVISLSTVPAGVASLGPTLRSLRNQSFAADAIELNLPLRSARGLGPYPELKPEDAEGIDVYRTDDWLALTNVVPTVQRAHARGGNTLVLVVDDDKAYPPSLVEDHVRAHRARPGSVSTCRGYMMPPGGDISPAVFFPAWDELWHSFYGHRLVEAQRVAVVTGSDSWSAPAELLGDGLWRELQAAAPQDGLAIGPAASLMNDVWVSGQLSQRGVPKFVVPCRRECQDVPRTAQRQEQNLQQRRLELNSRVMKFFLRDWAPEEIMALDEVKLQVWQVRAREPHAPPAPATTFLQWLAGAVARGFHAIFLGL